MKKISLMLISAILFAFVFASVAFAADMSNNNSSSASGWSRDNMMSNDNSSSAPGWSRDNMMSNDNSSSAPG
ncbi:MAG: hypothetical protein ACOH15_10920, partial [Acetobacterium sp.]